METREYKVYKFNELTEEQQEKAINVYRDSGIEYYWHDENAESLKGFCDCFGIDENYVKYSYGSQGEYISFSMPDYYGDDENILKFTGIRLMKYIINNYWDDIFTPVFKGSISHHVKHKRMRNKTGNSNNSRTI